MNPREKARKVPCELCVEQDLPVHELLRYNENAWLWSTHISDDGLHYCCEHKDIYG